MNWLGPLWADTFLFLFHDAKRCCYLDRRNRWSSAKGGNTGCSRPAQRDQKLAKYSVSCWNDWCGGISNNTWCRRLSVPFNNVVIKFQKKCCYSFSRSTTRVILLYIVYIQCKWFELMWKGAIQILRCRYWRWGKLANNSFCIMFQFHVFILQGMLCVNFYSHIFQLFFNARALILSTGMPPTTSAGPWILSALRPCIKSYNIYRR